MLLNLRRRRCHREEQQGACSALRASRQPCPQRIGHSLSLLVLLTHSRGTGTLTANEEGVAGKDGLARTVLHEVANAVLGVAGRVDGTDVDVANLERLGMAWGSRGTLAILTANNLNLGVAEGLEQRLVSASMIPVAISLALTAWPVEDVVSY